VTTAITMLGDGRARVERDGHTAEGRVQMTGEGFSFDGEFICGPHDADGRHLGEQLEREP